MPDSPSAHLFVVNDDRALAWILGQKRLAFSEYRSKSVQRLPVGHHMFLYATLDCFRGRRTGGGRSSVIGKVALTSPVRPLTEPYKLAGRVFPVGCTIELVYLIPRANAPQLAHLVPQLHAFRGAWNLRLRGSPVPLDQHDFRVISTELASRSVNPDEAIGDYLNKE